jgi:hypothetical protein
MNQPPPIQQPQIIIQQKSNKGCWIAAAIVFGLIVLLIGGCTIMGGLFLGAVGEGLEEVAKENERANAIPEEVIPIGETAQTEKFAVMVSEVEVLDQIKTQFSESTPANGGLYVAVLWIYKNITTEPISTFSTPTIHLLSPEGTKYSADIGASGDFATMVDLDRKILSDLNPGLQVTDGSVFEVSKEVYGNGEGWKLLVDGDRKLVFSTVK